MKKSFKWLGNITSFLLIIFIVLTVAFVLQTQLSEGKPKIFGHELMIVLSGSMEPEIQTGSVIAIKETENPSGYEVGDVITYHTASDANTYITHRVVDLQQEEGRTQYVLQGDNNNAPDADPVQAEQIVGHYSGLTIPYIGYVLNYAQSNQGIVLLLIVPGVLLLISSLIQIWQTVRNIEQDKQKTEEPSLVASISGSTPAAEHIAGSDSSAESEETVSLSRTKQKKTHR